VLVFSHKAGVRKRDFLFTRRIRKGEVNELHHETRRRSSNPSYEIEKKKKKGRTYDTGRGGEKAPYLFTCSLRREKHLCGSLQKRRPNRRKMIAIVRIEKKKRKSQKRIRSIRTACTANGQDLGGKRLYLHGGSLNVCVYKKGIEGGRVRREKGSGYGCLMRKE